MCKYKFFVNPEYGLTICMDSQTKLYGIIDSQNNIVVPFKYEWIGPFSFGVCRLYANMLWGYYFTQTKKLLEPQFKMAYDFDYEFSSIETINDETLVIGLDGITFI